MASLKQLLKQEVNPFDPTTHKLFNFWDERYEQIPIAESIHQEVIEKIEGMLGLVARDHITRSLILAGDSGSGKSTVLSRLKDQLNSKAFFVHIEHWTENDYIWRHMLRRTVDSLLQKPKGQTESQLLLWLKRLPVFREKGIQKWVLGERRLFIQQLRTSYPTDIYNPTEFFGVLYDLTNSELYAIASEWLKGNDLDEDDLRSIRVKKSIDSESAAKEIINNFGRIASATYPIVICFDNLDNVPKLPDGSLNLQPLFDINTTIHSRNLKNFLVIISLVTSNWRMALEHLQQADRASIIRKFELRSISLDQAEKLWAVRLAPLHQQANPKLKSPIAPLTRKNLEDKFPGGKTNPRSVMQIGYRLIEDIRQDRLFPDEPNGENTPRQDCLSPKPNDENISTSEDQLLAAFKLLWLQEFKETQNDVPKFRTFASLELIEMLRNALVAIQIKITKHKLLPSPTYASHSFSYLEPNKNQETGIIWTEESSMTSFFNIMKAASKAEEKKLCQALYLIRAEKTGSAKNQGYQLYKRLFDRVPNRHIVPDIDSLCHLVIYDRLMRSAKAGDLLILDKVIKLSELESLVREAKVFQGCALLQDLGIIRSDSEEQPSESSNGKPFPLITNLKNFILDFTTQHQIVSQGTITKHAQNLFVGVTDTQVQELIQTLCQENQLRILDKAAPLKEQIVCLVPSVVAGK